MTTYLEVRDVADRIRRGRFRYNDEADLQEGLAMCLDGLDVEREVILSPRDRIDLLVHGSVGIEVKVAGTPGAVERQCRRYLEDDRIQGLVLVTTKARHRLPDEINGKPVIVVSLVRLG